MTNRVFKIGNYEYELVNNFKDAFDKEVVLKKVTDYFEPFDYIFGDYSYDVLRLKGFYESSNSECRDINDIAFLERYIDEYCAYQCRYFLLKKIKKS